MRHIPKPAPSFALLICLVAALSISVVRGNPQMNRKLVDEPGFSVVGIQSHTNNAKEATPEGVISKQWARFLSGGLLGKIPDKADTSIFAVYSDYESDHSGSYSFLIGAKVNSDSSVPAGMVSIKVPAGRYAVFTTEKGPAQQVVPAAWKAIWAMQKSSLGGTRTFKTDFEVYDQRAADPRSSQVDIYIGIK
jgi:predicted transcriptional regulator YdeE